MPPFSPTFNPAQVMLGNQNQQPRAPYLPVKGGPIFNSPGGSGPGIKPPVARPPVSGVPIYPAQSPGQTIGAQSVRATGTGPYDQAYRQNLASYAGGLFNRPGGNLSFNPTATTINWSGGAQPTGGGNAPVMGTPTSLLAQALGIASPATQAGQGQQGQPNLNPAANTAPLSSLSMQNWLQNFMQQYMNGGSNAGY